MVKLRGQENLDAALNRINESSNLVNIDLSEFESKVEEAEAEVSITPDSVSDSIGEEE